MAVPPRLDRPMQVMDVRDLARLVVLLLEQDLPGAYNAVGPSPAVTLSELIATCGAAEVVPVPEGELDCRGHARMGPRPRRASADRRLVRQGGAMLG
jgi:nucleoside-diphosphate-sugar epimerase